MMHFTGSSLMGAQASPRSLTRTQPNTDQEIPDGLISPNVGLTWHNGLPDVADRTRIPTLNPGTGELLGDPIAAGLPCGLVLAVLKVVILGATGWLGGELTCRHELGVIGISNERRAGCST